VINSIEIEEVGHFSCSFGVACGLIKREVDFDKILKQSDDALYLAKNNGKNRVETHWK
jgi:PleD family two-component response regulator